MTGIFDNIEHAAECSCWTHYARKCDCWRAAIVEYVASLERAYERERDRAARYIELQGAAEAKLAAAREALERLADDADEADAMERLQIAADALDALADDAPTNPLDPMIEYMASNGVDEPDPWDGITPEMALRAAARIAWESRHESVPYAHDEIVSLTPARIRELAGGDDE